MLNTNKKNKMKIGEIIASQLGGTRRLNAMTGANNFLLLENGLSFRIKNPKANYIKIELNGKDLYDVEIGKVSGSSYKIVHEYKDIYNDQLKEVIEMGTGMYLSFEDGGAFGAGHFMAGGNINAVMQDASQTYVNYYLGEGAAQGVYAKGGMLSANERYVLEMAGLTGLRKEGILDFISENELTESETLNIVIGLGRKQLKGADVSTAVLGAKNNKYAKDVIEFAKSKKALMAENGGEFGAGHFAEGGLLSSSEIERLDDGFTIKELSEMLNNKFRYSFRFEAYKQGKNGDLTVDYDNKLKDDKLKLRFYDKTSGRDLNYEVMQGEENTYFHFLLSDSEYNSYVGTFGFKDKGDVGKEYVTRFVAFLHDAYHYPFSVKHSVMENGGAFGAGHFAKGGSVGKNPFEFLKKYKGFKYQIEEKKDGGIVLSIQKDGEKRHIRIYSTTDDKNLYGINSVSVNIGDEVRVGQTWYGEDKYTLSGIILRLKQQGYIEDKITKITKYPTTYTEFLMLMNDYEPINQFGKFLGDKYNNFNIWNRERIYNSYKLPFYRYFNVKGYLTPCYWSDDDKGLLNALFGSPNAYLEDKTLFGTRIGQSSSGNYGSEQGFIDSGEKYLIGLRSASKMLDIKDWQKVNEKDIELDSKFLDEIKLESKKNFKIIINKMNEALEKNKAFQDYLKGIDSESIKGKGLKQGDSILEGFEKYVKVKTKDGDEVYVVLATGNRTFEKPFGYAEGGVFGAGHFAEGGDIKAFTMQMVKGTGNINTEVITEDKKIYFEQGGAFGAGHFAKGGSVDEKFVPSVKFRVGDLVWDKGNKRYGTVMNIFGDPINGSYGEVRLDSDGMQMIFTYNRRSQENTGYNLIKLGEKGDGGNFTLDKLKETKDSANRLINSRIKAKDKENEEYYRRIYKRLLDGEFDSKVTYGKYIPYKNIKTVTIKKGGKEFTYKAEDVYNGVYVLENGGGLKGIAFYAKKADVVKVTLNDGSEVNPVNGFWIKKTAEPITGETTSDADSVFKRIIRDAKLVKVGDSKKYDAKDLKKINAEMVKKLLDVGYTEQQIRNKFLGYTHDNEVLADGEFAEYETSIFSYDKDYIPTIIQKLVDSQKEKQFSVTFEYPDFDWKEVIEKYKISNKPVDFVKEGDKSWRYDNYYQFFQGENIVVDHNYGYKQFDEKGNVTTDTTTDGKKISDLNKVNAWQKERGRKAGFNSGFWTVSSSKIEVIDDVLKMLTSQKDGYCKEIEFYSGYNSELLKKNGAKFGNGGSFEKPKKESHAEKISDLEWESILNKFLKNFMADYGQEASEYLNSKSINSDQPTLVSKEVVDRTVMVEESFPEATKKFISSLTPKEKSLVDITFDEGEFADAEDHDEIKNFSFIKVSKKQNSEKRGAFADGGVTFEEKSKAIAQSFAGKKVEPKYQSEYGKTYSREEASEVGNKIAGAQKAKYDAKVEKKLLGGGIGNPNLKLATTRAREIRKDGESWGSALKRAHLELKGNL